MTRAVCIKCGHAKLGALMRCRRYGSAPTQPDEPRSVLLSDHDLPREKLKEASLRRGDIGAPLPQRIIPRGLPLF